MATSKTYGATPPKTPKTDVLSIALEVTSQKHSVIPVGRDKKPLIDWKEFQERIATPEEVKEWWGKFPEANLGIVTGKISNITVVDVEKGGDISKFPKTLTIKTGGGGYHLYYKYYPINNKTRFFPLTDVRGDGGYVVAPPSLHASGNRYEVVERGFITEFPAWLFGEKKATFDVGIIDGVEKGSRNDSASKMAGKLLSTFYKQPEAAWRMLQSWNKSNIPPLSDIELRNVFNSIKSRENKKDHKAEPEETEDVEFITYTKVLEMGINELDNTKDDDVVSFGYDWLDEKLTGIFPSELIVLGGETGTGKTTFATNILYQASKKYKCGVFALEDRLPDYGIKAMFFKINSMRKIDKKSAYPWNDYRRNKIKDSDFAEYKKKAYEGLKNDKLFFANVKRQMNIETLERAIQEKVNEGFKLFLIDHLHYFDLLRGDANKSDYIEKVMVRMKQLQNQTGARIILVVHYKKLEGKKPYLDSFKDSIAIVQNANYVINLWRDRSKDANNMFETEISIPKSRNPNGECHIKVEFDPATNDFKKNKDWVAGIEPNYNANKEFDEF